MYKNKTFLAIILARGGSKRLPRKNILDLAGKPLIAWTIEAGLKSKYIDKVLVSSDDNEILFISKSYGANIIKRPAIFASDTATTYDAMEHAIKNIERYDYVVLLQPTSPLRNAKHIDEAIKLLENKNADAIISVCEVDHSPLWCNVLPEDGNMKSFLREETKNKRNQDLPVNFRLNGAIYICDTDVFLQEKTLFIKNNIFAYIMNRESSVDIDEEIDFKIANFLKEGCCENMR